MKMMILAIMITILLAAASCAGLNSNPVGREQQPWPPRSPSGHICTETQYCL